ncbi:hypothetical protein [Haloprofundus halobius]|uniref:hypothetical protein n=1 Tax=Haloprofundus halobius TaxID=2876194 RepID=UPI001CCE76C4|nr:hypothetical protein [Haloprofundus halobius]
MTDNESPNDGHDTEQTDSPIEPDGFVKQVKATAKDGGSSAGKAGRTIGGTIAAAVKGWCVFWMALVYWSLKPIPRTGALGAALINAGHKIVMKTTSADVICNVIYGDGVVATRGATWNSQDAEYETTNGEKFSAKGIGFAPKRVNGKFPVVWALREGREITEPLEAYMGTQRRLGNYEPHARADGGRDVAIDAETSGYEGRALSFRDGWRLFGSKVTQEDMGNQAKRAKLAELDFSRSDTLWVLLAALGGVALGLFGPALATSIAGGGSGTIPTVPIGMIDIANVLVGGGLL